MSETLIPRHRGKFRGLGVLMSNRGICKSLTWGVDVYGMVLF